MKVVEHRHVNTSNIPHIPESIRRDDLIVRCYKKIYALMLGSPVEQAEKLLHSYNEERYRLAYLFHKVAEYITKREREMSIDCSKDKFCPQKIKDMQAKILSIGKILVRKKIFSMSFIVVTSLLIVGSLIMGVLLVDDSRRHIYSNAVANLASIILVAAQVVLILSNIAGHNLRRRLQNAISDSAVEDFANMYARLQFAKKDGGRFFYDIKAGNITEADKAFYSTYDILYNTHDKYNVSSL